MNKQEILQALEAANAAFKAHYNSEPVYFEDEDDGTWFGIHDQWKIELGLLWQKVEALEAQLRQGGTE